MDQTEAAHHAGDQSANIIRLQQTDPLNKPIGKHHQTQDKANAPMQAVKDKHTKAHRISDERTGTSGADRELLPF